MSDPVSERFQKLPLECFKFFIASFGWQNLVQGEVVNPLSTPRIKEPEKTLDRFS